MTWTTSDPSPLREYVAAKSEVADLIGEALTVLRAHRPEDPALGNDLVVKLAEDRFNLAVVGQFKRGKSSLMNAVIGRDLLPTGILPLTSVITALCYGPRESVWLRRRDSRFKQEIRTDELADYVTERGNPGNEKRLLEARVEMPLAFLRRGLYFIDTPGVGSASRENTATAYDFLPSADAVIFVTSVDSPLGAEEQQFLTDIRAHVSRLMVVVNKIDEVEGSELEEVLAYIRDRVAETIGTVGVPVFPVSARAALDAKVRDDLVGLQQSGLLEFEDALTEFLANEQGRAFLVGMLDRTIHLLGEIRQPIDPTNGAPDPLSLLARAGAVRDRLLGGGPLSVPVSEGPTEADVSILEEAARSSGRSTGSGPGRRSRTTGCPVCGAQGRAIFEFFAQWQHKLATDLRAQQAFAAAGGFCPAHTWQFQQLASPQGLSTGYAPLVELVQREIVKARDESSLLAASRLRGLSPGNRSCAACGVLLETERDVTLESLQRIAAGGEPAGEIVARDWCLGHLHGALATDLSPDVVRLLIGVQAEQLLEIVEDMRSYGLKRAAVRQGLINSREADAWRRALVRLAGERTARGVMLGTDEASWPG